MSDILSQEQIDALLKSANIEKPEDELSDIEIDVLGEIGNICIGTSATALNQILEETISINTPSVQVMTWEEISKKYDKTCVCIKVYYTLGLEGYNLMILKENDAKIITNLMLKDTNTTAATRKDEALNEIHLSAVSEVMNQLVGSSATSMSLLISKKVDISPPEAFILNLDLDNPEEILTGKDKLVKISFKMEVEGLLNSEIMQILPIDFAKKLIKNLLDSLKEHPSKKVTENSSSDKNKININGHQTNSSIENIDERIIFYEKQLECLKSEYEYIKRKYESEVKYLQNECIEKNKQLNTKDEILKSMQNTLTLLIQKH